MSHLSLFSYTYEVSPVFLLVEEAILKKMIEFIGWEEGDGIFNPGKNPAVCVSICSSFKVMIHCSH